MEKNEDDYINSQSDIINTENRKIVLERIKKYICEIVKNDGTKGIGFLCRIPYQDKCNSFPALITSSHILSSKDLTFFEEAEKVMTLKNGDLVFNYDTDLQILKNLKVLKL